MQTDTQNQLVPASPLTVARVGPISSHEINDAFGEVLASLKAVSDQTRVFFQNCVTCGNLLKEKRDQEYRGDIGWVNWLEVYCPDVSRMTAYRLISIAELNAKQAISIESLPDRLSSIDALLRAMRPAPAGGTTTPPELPAAPVSKLGSAIARFWGFCHKRPPEKWEETERSEFLMDLAERDRIRRKQGWEMPVIDV